MKSILFAAAAALFQTPAIAADPTPAASVAPAKPDAAAVDAAVRMLEAQDFESQLLGNTDVMIEGLIAVQIEQLQKATSDDPIPDELLTTFRETMRSHALDTMKAKMPAIKRQSAEIYAREFTVDELRRMTEIAADPVMVKSRTKGQALASQLMMVGMTAMRESQDELKLKLEQMVHDYLEKAGLSVDEKS